MLVYLQQRLALALPVVFGVSVVVFATSPATVKYSRSSPSDPVGPVPVANVAGKAIEAIGEFTDLG